MSGAEWLLILGWLLAGAGWSAYLATRAHIKDVKWWTQLDRQESTAVVTSQKDPEEKAREIIDEEGLERLASDIQEQSGVDPKVAMEEARRMVSEVQRLGGGW